MKRRWSLTPEKLELLVMKTEPWLSCDDCFDQVDAVVDDLVVRGVALPSRFRTHLRGCPACCEETRALVELVAADDGIDPRLPTAQLDEMLARH